MNESIQSQTKPESGTVLSQAKSWGLKHRAKPVAGDKGIQQPQKHQGPGLGYFQEEETQLVFCSVHLKIFLCFINKRG